MADLNIYSKQSPEEFELDRQEKAEILEELYGHSEPKAT